MNPPASGRTGQSGLAYRRLVAFTIATFAVAPFRPVLAQGNLPSAPPVPVVTNDGSANADAPTPMTIEPSDPVFSADQPYVDSNVAGDPSYTQPQGPYSPQSPETANTYEGPVGVTGIFNGNITTGCSYDPLAHSAHRAIDDIVVPGAVGKYPLKMTRYYNSRQQYYALGAIALSPGWAHEYSWLWWGGTTKIVSPHGNVYDFFCGAPVGVAEGWDPNPPTGTAAWRLADGGRVIFVNGIVTYIDDPYGLRTTIAWDNNGQRKVTEPGGRCLWFTYGPDADQDGTVLLTRVEAYDVDGSPGSTTHPTGHLIDWVNYTYQVYDPITPSIQQRQKKMLRRVDYSDGTQAWYDYRTDNVPENQTSHKMYPLAQRCDDVRYNGPMRSIRYEYQGAGPHGVIIDEKCPGVGAVSAIAPGVPTGGAGSIDTFTETRGDGPTRTFTYTHLSHCTAQDCSPCDDYLNNNPPQQMLTNYTDFQGHTTILGYDSNWYINSVIDANNHITSYTRGNPPPGGIGEIKTVTLPAGTTGNGVNYPVATIQYGYESTPQYPRYDAHYLTSVTDENGKITTITRNTNHRITHIDYPQDAYTPASSEDFTYNGFGQVLTHHLKNGNYQHFQYDSRGLLVAKTNPTATADWQTALNSAPKTTYTYYQANDPVAGNAWIDRVKTTTLPPNYPYNFQAVDTFEYDKNGQNQPCAGRGLVTKIRHWTQNGDKIQSFGYNQFGNKVWEKDEVVHQTSYAYDSYNRVVSVTNPLTKTTHYDYSPTQGNTTQCYLHTNNSPCWVTTPAGIVTNNIYDENFRKTSTTVASATTWFHYDPVGNQDHVTDPRGSGPCNPTCDPTYTTTTGYDTRNRKWQVWDAQGHETIFTYDQAGNVTRIDHPDGGWETKTYDAVNRVLTDTVLKDSNGNTIPTTFNYNPSGTINWVRNGNSYTTTFAYDEADQRKTMTYPGGSTQQWAYDDAHNMKAHTAVSGHIQDFGYDERNRNYADWWDANASVPEWRYFVRDAAHRLIEAKNGTAAWGQNVISDVVRAYDNANHLTLDQQNPSLLPGGARSVNYFYDDDGKVNRMYASGGSYDYTFTYDGMGRFEKIFVNNGAQLFQYHYDAASNEGQRDNLSDNVTQIYPRDNLNRMQYLDVRNGNSTLGHEAYGYDPMSRVTSVTRNVNDADSFTYYKDGELNAAQYGSPSRSVTYTVDNVGNRQSMVENGTSTSYSPNAINEYASVTGCTISNAGPEHEISQFKAANDTQTVTYTYINDGRLNSGSSTNGGNTYSYNPYYDALGRCVKRSVTVNNSTTTTYYIYDGEKPVVEFDSTGAVTARNLYGKGIDEILMRTLPATNGTLYYQHNHEGSVTLVTNAGGGVIEKYKYDAFGAPTFYDANWNQINYSTFNNRFLFTGREYAAATANGYNAGFKFYEYRARAYNAALGRFMSEDPKLFDAGDYNVFRYCHNDPLDLTDPMGLESPAWAQAIIPGQIEWDNAVANFQAGNYGSAAGWAATMVAQQYLAVATLGTSTRAQQSFQAARIAMAEQQAASTAGRAFSSFSAFKQALGPAGVGQQWHHIVEQNPRNLAQFGNQAIHNTNNLVRLPTEVHQQISGYYSSKQAFTGGQTVREWLSRQPFETQRGFGQRIIQQYQQRAIQQGAEDEARRISELEHGLDIKPR
jgi:RHS repeat-associated protein